MSEWRSGSTAMERTTTGPIAVGSTWQLSGRAMGQDIRIGMELTEFEPDSRLSFKTTSGPVHIEAQVEFEPEDGATHLRFKGSAEPKGMLRFAEPMLARQLDEQWESDMALLKGLLEGRK